jgi:hypothetical protein
MRARQAAGVSCGKILALFHAIALWLYGEDKKKAKEKQNGR